MAPTHGKSCCNWLLWLATPLFSYGNLPEPKTTPSAATIASYKAIGARYGGWIQVTSGFQFKYGDKFADAGVPGFSFKTFPKVDLPNVIIPFGIELGYSDVTDVGLSRLAHLKNLTMLSLVDTRITDIGVKEISGLKQLTVLCLQKTKITNSGLRYLATLDSLKSLFLDDTRIGDDGIKELAGLTDSCAANGAFSGKSCV